jgi:hypothetical protein
MAQEITITLTEEQRTELLKWLEQAYRDTLVEEHRTEAHEFREYVARRETIFNEIIAKLKRPGS